MLTERHKFFMQAMPQAGHSSFLTLHSTREIWILHKFAILAGYLGLGGLFVFIIYYKTFYRAVPSEKPIGQATPGNSP